MNRGLFAWGQQVDHCRQLAALNEVILKRGCVFLASEQGLVRESVDSLCREGTDTQYMQYLSKSRITSPQ